jgi:type I restriction enzyme S subunit
MNKKWKECKLGECLEKIVGGGTPSKKNSAFWGGDIFWATVKDMKDGVYKLDSTVEKITKEGLNKSSSKLIPQSTVIISTRMGLGRCFVASIDTAINQDLKALFPKKHLLETKYLLWLMAYLGEKIQFLGTGTTVKGITVETLKSLEISLPPLPTQQKIAGILSAYDDLIENNTRRIEILEEMARMLYREWFVKFRFRFPFPFPFDDGGEGGGDRPELVESELGLIPKDWEVVKLGDVAKINQSSLKKDNVPEIIKYINISSVSTGKVNEIETLNYCDASSRARRKVKHGDIIWSTVRPNLKAYALILHPQKDLIVSTGFAVISSQNVPYSYLYHYLTTDDFVGYLTNNATGSAYPAVNQQDFKNADVLIPPQTLLSKFHTVISDMFEKKHNLLEKNINLRKTRDLLLPRLISGEIDVEELDINLGAIEH